MIVNKYDIIAGQRRYLAIKKINNPTILCNIVDKSDQDCILISIIENVQRNTMKLSDKVKMYQKLHNNFNYDSKEMSKKINISSRTINQYLKISSLSDKILDRLDEPINSSKKISLEFAIHLVSLGITDDEELLEIIIIFDNTNGKEKNDMIKLIKKQVKYQGNNFNIKYIKNFKIKYLQDKKKEKIINKWKSYCEYNNRLKKIYFDKWKNVLQPVPIHKIKIKKQEIYQERKIMVRNSKLQEEYRTKLINRFDKCIISGMFNDVCEAAHIVPFSESDDQVSFDINNGLLLNRILHKLFDNYEISINPITLNLEILKTCKNYEFIKIYEDKPIKILKNYPDTSNYLHKHYHKFLQK